MSRLNVLIVDCARDEQQAHGHASMHGLATIIASKTSFVLYAAEPLMRQLADVQPEIGAFPAGEACALIVFAEHEQAVPFVREWMATRGDLVVLLVDRDLDVLFALRDPQLGPVLDEIRRTAGLEIAITNDLVVIKSRNPGVDALLEQLLALTERDVAVPAPRTGFLHMVHSAHGPTGQAPPAEPPAALPSEGEPPREPPSRGGPGERKSRDNDLLKAAIVWIEGVLPVAVASIADGVRKFNPFTFTPDTIRHEAAETLETGDAAELLARERDDALRHALDASQTSAEPLAIAYRALGLSWLEFRLFVLALAPDIDPRYQRCILLLSDYVERRVGTLGLYCSLLGSSVEVRTELERDGHLARARAFAARRELPGPDEPMALDPPLSAWILGDENGLESDPLVRRLVRLASWPGQSLIVRPADRAAARALADRMREERPFSWLVIATRSPADWRAFVEVGLDEAHRRHRPLRIDAARIAGLDVIDIEDSGTRLTRLARCTGRPMIVDLAGMETTAQSEDALGVFLEAVAAESNGIYAARVTVLCSEEARVLRLVGTRPHEVLRGSPLGLDARIAAIGMAAERAGAALDEDVVESLARRHQLDIAEVELAQSLAASREPGHERPDESRARIVAALNEAAAQGLSAFAERVEPMFELDDVQLPEDRKRQLQEIIDNVTFESDVLDGWRFGEQLPYGRGVAVLLHGPSGCGKTMASFAIAKRLGVQVLRLNLSKVMSRWLGESEKAMDRILTDAENSGCAVMVEEADALLHRRSDVLRGGSSSHERYSDVEIAFLLTRLENYTGLAFFTTNLRQNVDPAFLRRLRFVVEFPRPDMNARDKIWRRCLPIGSHALTEGDYRQLARRLDVTGGSIRQITLRAAFLAVAENARKHQPFSAARIGLSHIADAARAEYNKLGLPFVELELPQRAAA